MLCHPKRKSALRMGQPPDLGLINKVKSAKRVGKVQSVLGGPPAGIDCMADSDQYHSIANAQHDGLSSASCAEFAHHRANVKLGSVL